MSSHWKPISLCAAPLVEICIRAVVKDQVMNSPNPRTALVEIAVAALLCEGLPGTHALFRDSAIDVLGKLQLSDTDPLRSLAHAYRQWAIDESQWRFVRNELRTLYSNRAIRHLHALDLGPK